MKGESATLATHHLFDTSEDVIKLSQTDADLLHHFVAHMLCLSKRAHPYIQLEIYFLCTIVIYPYVGYYKKLAMVINYMQGIIGLTLILSIDKSVNIK